MEHPILEDVMRLAARRSGLALLALCGATALGQAQNYSGVYTMSGNGSTITLTLQQEPTGRVTGSLTGNMAFQVEAMVQQGMLVGYASAPTGRLYLQAQPSGTGLQVVLAEVGADGQPQQQTAQTVMMTRTGAPAALGGPMNAAPPMGAGRADASADPVAGTWANAEMQVVFQRQGQGYAGTASIQGATYPIQAQYQAGRLQGQYQANGQLYAFQAEVQGAQMRISADNQVIVLQRQGGAPAAMGGAPGGMAQPGMGADGMAGGGPQDQQLRQLLLGSAWCSFRYSQVSGTTSTERVVFRADGTGALASGRESYNSGPNGSVFGSSSGGEAFQWTTRGGQLYINGQVVPGSITTNSNGSPIINANGKEYSMCR